MLETSIYIYFFFIFFSPKFKLNISLTYKAIIIIFLVNLSMVNIYKFCKNEIVIQTPGEPREQRFFGSCDFNFNFFAVFSKKRPTISTLAAIKSFMKFFVAQTSITHLFLQLLKS